MKSKIQDRDIKKKTQKYEKEFNRIFPEDFYFFDLIVKGKQIQVDMRELAHVANCEDPLEIAKALNVAASYLYYFGRVKVDMEYLCEKVEQDFSTWFASKKERFEDEGSEKAKERAVMVKYKTKYLSWKKRIRRYNRYKKMADVAFKSMDRHSELIRSISSVMKKNEHID